MACRATRCSPRSLHGGSRLALGARASGRDRLVAWSTLAGLLLGWCVMSSYGLPCSVLAIGARAGPLVVAPCRSPRRRRSPLVLGFAAYGFAWWEALPVLRERYWDGIAADRPGGVLDVGNLAALVVCAGPCSAPDWRCCAAAPDRVVLLLGSAAVACVVLADLSPDEPRRGSADQLPFVPWLLLSTRAASRAGGAGGACSGSAGPLAVCGSILVGRIRLPVGQIGDFAQLWWRRSRLGRNSSIRRQARGARGPTGRPSAGPRWRRSRARRAPAGEATTCRTSPGQWPPTSRARYRRRCPDTSRATSRDRTGSPSRR